jgi:hypothetical protein
MVVVVVADPSPSTPGVAGGGSGGFGDLMPEGLEVVPDCRWWWQDATGQFRWFWRRLW